MIYSIFFFQAEDGIRDTSVTGVQTCALPIWLDEVIAAIGRQIEQGARAYWVCPLVDDSEVIDLAAATERSADLSARFGADRRSEERRVGKGRGAGSEEEQCNEHE